MMMGLEIVQVKKICVVKKQTFGYIPCLEFMIVLVS